MSPMTMEEMKRPLSPDERVQAERKRAERKAANRWRLDYLEMTDDELRTIICKKSKYTLEQRNKARAIVAGRASAKNRTRKPTVNMFVCVSPEMRDEALRLTKKLRMSMSAFVRQAIENELAEYSDD